MTPLPDTDGVLVNDGAGGYVDESATRLPTAAASASAIAVLDVDSMDDEKLIVHPFATREAAIKAFDFSRGGNADEDAGSEDGSPAEGKNNTIVFSSVKLTTLEV